MKITASTELMTNQKHADVMAPDGFFDVLQTQDGDALFFSIGTDHVFYVTREARQSNTGWTRIDLSSQLSAANGGTTVRAKAFDVAQNPRTMEVDVALVVTVAGADMLYLSRGHSTSAEAWAQGIKFTRVPFDAAGIPAPEPLTIADIYLMDLPSEEEGEPPIQNIFVDIIARPGDPLKLLDRYFITPDAPTRWTRHHLPTDLKAGTISSCLGRRVDDYVPGIYTYGLIENTRQLIFRPQYNFFRPKVAPNSARLNLPQGATAIASASNSLGFTNLFVAGSKGLYVFTPDNQSDKAEPTLVVPTATVGKINLFNGIYSMSASTIGDRTVVWALNANGTLFYAACPAGSEANPSAWNHPLPLYQGVENFAFYLNGAHSASTVLFAHLNGNAMMQFTQDAGTSEWQQKRILLPTTDLDKYVEFTSFTSHLRIVDNNDAPVPEAEVGLTARSQVAVYVNNVYHVLTPDVPIFVKTDIEGILNIIQETESLFGVTIDLTADDGTAYTIDPMTKAIGKLSAIQSGEDLSRVMLTQANGSKAPLIPGDVPKDVRDSVAKSLVQLIRLKDQVQDTPAGSSKAMNFGVTGSNTNAKRTTLASSPRTVSLPIKDAIPVVFGDLFTALKSAWDDFKDWVIEAANDTWRFIVKIGNDIYVAILDCIPAIIDTIEMVFNKIKVFFEDLKKWLGFLFEWDDIKRTHTVIKHIIKSKVASAIDSLDGMKHSVVETVSNMEASINALTGLKDPGTSIGTQRKGTGSLPGTDEPQCQWGVQHFKSGFESMSTDVKEPSFKEVGLAALKDILDELVELGKDEITHVETMIVQINEEVVNKYDSLTGAEVLKRLLGILSGLLVRSAGTLITKLIEIFKIVAHGVLDMLDAPVRLGVLSAFYKSVTGNELTMLDLACWVGAIPATLVYKFTTGRAPFPSDSDVRRIVGSRNGSKVMMASFDLGDSSTPAVRSLALGSMQSDALSGHSNIMSLRSNLDSNNSSEATPPVATSSDADQWGHLQPLQILFNSMALPGALCLNFLNGIKFGLSKQDNSLRRGARVAGFVFYLLYVAPNYVAWSSIDSPATQLNIAVTGVSILKASLDIVDRISDNPLWQDFGSPLAETIINATWLLPTGMGVSGSSGNPSDWLLFTGNILCCLGGIISFGATDKFGPKVQLITMGVQAALAQYYGMLCMVSGISLSQGK